MSKSCFVVKVTDSWLANQELKPSTAEDLLCRGALCTLNLSGLKRPLAAGVERIQLLNKSNWNSWKENMKILLMERGCWSFIEEMEPTLAETTATKRDKSEYKQRQDRALATIYYGIDESNTEL
ncbi:f-box only protein 38 [Trichonephila clavipes]|uniref:F-box only protein 38 n=1 Tax=Trichonephila clavipes TaxID=2585209 RepID=A0A8X6W8J3_TRICX|nr:f-box only protein 38 [Trichonephila clavipes]